MDTTRAIAVCTTLASTGLSTFRWAVEGTISWLHSFRRLRIRWELRDDTYEAFFGLAACLITHRHIQRLC